MDLADLADRLVGGAARDAAVSWLAELSTSMPYGEPVRHHIEGEVAPFAVARLDEPEFVPR